MQLIFQDVQKTERSGVPCILQRAEVTDNGFFWVWWRKSQSPLKLTVSVRNEDGKYYAYRLMPMDNGLKALPRLPAYSLRNTKGLLPYQPRAVASLCSSLLKHGKALDGSDTGVGKTYVSAAVCRELGFKACVLCTKANIGTWIRVLTEFKVPIAAVTNWETVKIRKNGRFMFCHYDAHYDDYQWNLPAKTLIIFDEAHFANHSDSLNYKVYRASIKYPSISVSATMADKLERLQFLFNLFNIIPEHAFSSWIRSRGHYEHPYNEMELEGLSDSQDMAEVGKYLYTNFGCRLSISDSDVRSYFPDVMYESRLIDIGSTNVNKQQKSYQQMMTRVQTLVEEGKQAEALNANLKYRQTAELLKTHALAELATNYVKQGNSVVLFVNFLDTLFYLSNLLHTTSLIYGGQDSKISRTKVIEDFQADRTPIIIAMLAAGGQSISLHDLHGNRRRISLICPTYNPYHIKQVLGRTYRALSRTPPLIQLVYTLGTIEEQVSQRVAMKIRAIDSLNQGDLVEDDIFNVFKGRIE